MAKLFLVVLACNEEASLPGLLDGLAAACAPLNRPVEVAVVDDGSSDGTSRAARAFRGLPLTLLSHPSNYGVAAAFDTGLRHVLASGGADDLVVTLEGDGTNPPELLPALVAALDTGADVVCASRYRAGGSSVGFPWSRRFLSRSANLLCRWRWGVPGITDYSFFYRGYRLRRLQDALRRYGPRFIESRGFAANVELLLKAVLPGPARCAEVPVTYRYDLKSTPSLLRVGRTIADYLGLFLRMRRR